MSRTIYVDLPDNITHQEAELFKPHVHYNLRELDVLHLEEVFVTYTGLCIDESGVRIESHHDYADKRSAFVHDAAVHFKQALDHPENLIELDDDEMYLLIHHPWAQNYWHWMTEAILRVWMVRDKTHSMVLILPESYRNTSFILQSLEGFSFKSIFYIPIGKQLLVRNLCVPEVKRIADSYYPESLHDIRQYYLQKNKLKDPKTGERIYISRKLSAKRKVVNENAVEALLRQYNFNCICNEDIDFNEQVNLYAHADVLISIHGAGLTNMLFMKPGSSILELHKKRTNDHDWHSLAFWYMARALDFSYHHQLCDPENAASTFFEANFIVDIRQLEKNVQFMLGLNS